MPFRSQAQRKFMYSQHPEIAKHWQKETPHKKLPDKVKNYSHAHIERAKQLTSK